MKKENTSIGFSLQGIKTEQFAVFEKHCKPGKEADLAVQVQFKLDQESRHIGVFAGFEFLHTPKVFLKIVVSCHFRIAAESWTSFISEDQSQLVIPKVFLTHIAMITVSSARGVLFAKTEGTEFSNTLLPLINITKIITEDARFEIKK